MKASNQLSLAVLLFLMSFVAGCASVPMASMDEDTKAKSFVVRPDKSNIYVYRNESFGGAIWRESDAAELKVQADTISYLLAGPDLNCASIKAISESEGRERVSQSKPSP